MKLNKFIHLLKAHKSLELIFEYANNKFTKPSYHLTEVKNINYQSVDCGGKSNQWKETHIQLWESPKEKNKKEFLTVNKFMKILKRVDSINQLWLETEVKIEFGNEEFHTSIMDITDFRIIKNQLIIKLFSVNTTCKAISETEENCC
jgi:hypothetical protein